MLTTCPLNIGNVQENSKPLCFSGESKANCRDRGLCGRTGRRRERTLLSFFLRRARLAQAFRITLASIKDRAKAQFVQQFAVTLQYAEEFVWTAVFLVSGNCIIFSFFCSTCWITKVVLYNTFWGHPVLFLKVPANCNSLNWIHTSSSVEVVKARISKSALLKCIFRSDRLLVGGRCYRMYRKFLTIWSVAWNSE